MATINLMPGDMAVSLFFFNPLSAGRTEQKTITYTPSGKMTPGLAAYFRYSAEVLSEEDNRLCESVQRGLASRGYRQGRFVVDPDAAPSASMPSTTSIGWWRRRWRFDVAYSAARLITGSTRFRSSSGI